MFKNYVKIAWRNLLRRKFYALLNIVGLAVGLAFTLLIGSYVWGEWQVNRQLRHADRQYMLLSRWKDPNMGLEVTTLAPLARRLREDYPTLVDGYYRWDGLTSIVSKGDKHLREGIQLGDSTLLAMYGFELLYGDARTALQDPFSVLITAEKALKYFGKTDVVGQSIDVQNFAGGHHDFLVTGVLKDIPENSVTQINADISDAIFIPASAYPYFGRSSFDSWQNAVLPSYIKLRKGVSPAQLTIPIRQLLAKYADETIRRNLRVEPVLLTAYYRQKDRGLVNRMLGVLAVVGLFILLMAVINFVNLSVSQAGTRLREIGVRKALGSSRRRLTAQFLVESILLTLLATLLALGMYSVGKPLFEQLVGKPLTPLLSLPVYTVCLLLFMVVAIGTLAGVYPALLLASQHVIKALRGKLPAVRQGSWLRQGLVGFQYAVAAVVLLVAALLTQQVRYFFGQQLGYNQAYVVSAQVPRDWSSAGVQKMESVRQAFAKLPQLASVSLSHEIPNGNNGGQPLVYPNGTDSTQAVAMQALVTDENYLNTYQIRLAAGRFFDGRAPDSLQVVLNEKAVQALQYKTPNEAVGRQVRVNGDPRLFTVAGVTRDFHFGSMQQAVSPILVFSVKGVSIYRYLSFKVRPGSVDRSLEAIQRRWASLLPGSSFEYTFMDDTLRKLYRTELQLEKAAYVATGLALFIALLGVIGLVSLSVTRRAKEVSIRKVLGASVASILRLFLKEYILVIVVANAVAWPLAYWLITEWLTNYAYHTSIGWQPFATVGVLLAGLTGLVVSSQVIRTALLNPVASLRSE